MMNRNTSVLAALALGAFVGGGAVWWNVRDEAAGERSDDSLRSVQPAVGVIASPRAATPMASGTPNEQASAIRPAAVIALPDGESAGAGLSTSPTVSNEQIGATRPAAVSNPTPPSIRTTMRRNDLPAQATIVDQVVIPVPSEIFIALNKVGRPHWKEVLRAIDSPVRPRSGAEETALLLGNVIAEGFIAVEAQHPGQVRRVGQSVLNLSVAIGVRKTVMVRSAAILQGADRRDWPRVRTELDRALSDVKSAMSELNSETLADLVSLGGWLRGAEALATVVHEDFEPTAAELLHQPALVEHFSKRLAGLSPRARSLEIIVALDAGLTEIKPHIVRDRPLGREQVAEILKITSRLTKLIEGPRGR